MNGYVHGNNLHKLEYDPSIYYGYEPLVAATKKDGTVIYPHLPLLSLDLTYSGYLQFGGRLSSVHHPGMFVVGFGSFMFHGTMRLRWEMWDEVPMFLGDRRGHRKLMGPWKRLLKYPRRDGVLINDAISCCFEFY